MCIIFTCGEQTFRSEVEGYEGLVCRCFNCGNYSGHVLKTHPWFTFCFVPVIPLSVHGFEDVRCHICNFGQPLESRPDVQAMRHGHPHGHRGHSSTGSTGGTSSTRPGVPLESQPQPGVEQQPPPPGNMRYG